VDGLEVAGSVKGVIRDRRHLAEDGVVVVTIAVDWERGEIVQGPDLDGHGYMDDPQSVFDKAAQSVRDELASVKWPIEPEALRRRVKGAVNRVSRAETGKRTVVIPVILEV